MFGSILHYYRPLPEVLEYLERARYHGLETGDYIFVSYACSHSAIVQFGAGTPLRSLAAQTDEYLHLMRRTRVASSTAALKVVRRLVACLQGETAGPTSLGGPEFDEDAFFAAAERDRLTFATLWYCIAKLYLCLVHGELDAAKRWIAAAEQRLLNLVVVPHHRARVLRRARPRRDRPPRRRRGDAGEPASRRAAGALRRVGRLVPGELRPQAGADRRRAGRPRR